MARTGRPLKSLVVSDDDALRACVIFADQHRYANKDFSQSIYSVVHPSLNVVGNARVLQH